MTNFRAPTIPPSDSTSTEAPAASAPTNGVQRTSNGVSPPYVVPDIFLGDPTTRPLKVITAGCGISGIMMAYKIQQSLKHAELVMYDKNTDIGGTWFENKYPGAGCDIPCHAYSFNFALNPDWPQYCAYQKDIWKYLDKVCEVFDLRKYMKFESRITRAEWIAETGKWKISVEQKQDDGSLKTFDDECDVFLYAVGVLNNYKFPELKGIDKFKGKIFHSATWPSDYQEKQWKNDRVAVVGSGASSIQIVTHVQPAVKSLDVFVRTGTLFSAIADNLGEYQDYTQEEKESFSTPENLVAHVKGIEDKMCIAMDFQIAGTQMAKDVTNFFRQRMREHIKDERLLEGFTPTWDLGCRRVVPADPYMRAIQKPNVHVHFAAAAELTEDSIIDAKGIETKVDTVVCATGFDTAHRARFPIIGKDGVNLAEQWGDHPEAYLGLAVPNMPNFFTFMGPAYPVHNGSIMGPLTFNGDYIIDVMQKMQYDHIKSLSPRVDVTAKFNAHVQEWVKRTVWTQSCRSWFKNNETGRITALWPGTALHYNAAILRPRYEDYDIEYLHENPWAILGNGWSWAEKTQGVDSTPFLDVNKLDPKWVEAVFPKKPTEA